VHQSDPPDGDATPAAHSHTDNRRKRLIGATSHDEEIMTAIVEVNGRG